MKTDLAVQNARPLEQMKLTAGEILANVKLIQEVLKKVMIKGVHYDIVPGCGDKEVLLKPGAEYIMVLFRLSGEPIIEDLSNEDEIRYRVRIRVTHQVSRNEVGWGVGECSSNETKYKWIKAEIALWNDTPDDQRRTITKTSKTTGKPYTVTQVRANISDVANTVLKMAKKRALVDATLTCTAASDVFNQDIEDMPEGLRQNVVDKPAVPPMPQRASEKPPVAPAGDSNDSEEDPPVPAAPARRRIDTTKAIPMNAKFTADCKMCGKEILEGTPQLYIREGSDKGPYHVLCAKG